MLEQGKAFSLWEAAETVCDELTVTPIPWLPCSTAGEGVEQGRREGWGVCFEGLVLFLIILLWFC